MRYNIFDLYDFNISHERLKELATKFDYKYDGNQFDATEFLSGLKPNILSSLQFEIKFKSYHPTNVDWKTDSILRGDSLGEEYKLALFNVAVQRAYLNKLVDKYIQDFYQDQELQQKIEELKKIEKEQHESENSTSLLQQKQREMQTIMSDYLQRRMQALEEIQKAIRELNERERQLIQLDRKLLEKYSKSFSNKLDNLQDKEGNKFLANLTKEQKEALSEELFDKYYKVDRKYSKKETAIKAEIANLSQQQKGNQVSAFESRTGVVGSLHQQHRQLTSLESRVITDRIQALEGELVILEKEKNKETREVTKEVANNHNLQLNDNQLAELEAAVKKSEEYQNCVVRRDQVKDVIEEIVEERIELDQKGKAIDELVEENIDKLSEESQDILNNFSEFNLDDDDFLQFEQELLQDEKTESASLRNN